MSSIPERNGISRLDEMMMSGRVFWNYDRLQKTSEKVFRQGINLNSPEPFSFEDICHKGFLLDAVRVGKVELRDGFWLSV